MYAQLLNIVVAALAVSPAAASPVDVQERTISQYFHLKGNNTGLAKVDGALLGARPLTNTVVGFNLPYGQKPQLFGYDNDSAYVYGATTSDGKRLQLGAFVKPGNSAVIRSALPGTPGMTPISCAVIAKTLLCGAIINGTNFHDLIVADYRNDGNYELGIATSSEGNTLVELLIEP